MHTANKKFDTRYMVELAMMIAIILLMSFTPLGYWNITPGLSISFLSVPVAVGAIILGPKGGAICGLAFGATSFSMAFGSSALSTMLLSINPVGTFITCVVARVLEGWITGLIFSALYKQKSTKPFSYYVASLACPLLNTLFFMGFLCIFFYNTEYIQGIAAGLGVGNPILFIAAFVGIQALVEAVACFVIASIVSRALFVALKRS